MSKMSSMSTRIVFCFALGLVAADRAQPTPAPLELGPLQVGDVFASFYPTYTDTPLGTVQIHNSQTDSLELTVRFSLPYLMTQPTEQILHLAPQTTQQVELKVSHLKPKRPAWPEATPIQAEVAVSVHGEIVAHKTQTLTLYGYGALRWERVEQAAAFITSSDGAVAAFTRSLLVAFEQDLQVWGSPGHHLLQAVLLFEGLKQHGIGYVADANIPNGQNSAGRAAVDHIQYPAEVLYTKAGDYDDLTVLFCSLLENAGIPTALVGYPGSILLLFDSGISQDRAHQLPLGQQRYLLWQDRLWIPLKITQTRASFDHVWQAGADHISQLTHPELERQMVETAVAWQQYPPAAPAFTAAISPPERALVEAGFLAQFETLQRMVDEHIDKTYLDPLKREPRTDALRSEMLKLYLGLQQYDTAISQAQDYLLYEQVDKGKILNPLGIAHFLKGNPKQAALHFKQALDLYPEDMGIQDNLTRALEALGRAATLLDTLNAEHFYWIK